MFPRMFPVQKVPLLSIFIVVQRTPPGWPLTERRGERGVLDQRKRALTVNGGSTVGKEINATRVRYLNPLAHQVARPRPRGSRSNMLESRT